MKIAVVGAGAIGSLFAYFFHRAGNTPWLLDRDPDLVRTLERKGLTVETATATHRIPLSTATSDPGAAGTVDLILIAVKAYDTERAVGSVTSLIGEGTLVLTLQNGLYNIERIARVTGNDRVIGGVTSQGATLIDRGHIRHAGSGETVIGSLCSGMDSRVGAVCDFLNRSGISTTVTGDLNGTIWSKLIINAAINPLTAITRLTNGEIIEHEGLLDIQRKVIGEACTVAGKRGVAIHHHDPQGTVRAVCRATAVNKSSMLQDILRGKRTEIDYINGAIAAEGEPLGVATPYNHLLTRLVKALEMRFIREING